MTDSTLSTDGRAPLCESLSAGFSSDTCPSTEETRAADDFVRCSADATGKFRIAPDYGDPVSVWLCEDHQHAYDEWIIEMAAVV